MKAYPLDGGIDVGGVWVRVGIYPDTADPTALTPDGAPQNNPIAEYVARPTLADLNNVPALTPRQLFARMVQHAIDQAKQDGGMLSTKAGFQGALANIPKTVVQF